MVMPIRKIRWLFISILDMSSEPGLYHWLTLQSRASVVIDHVYAQLQTDNSFVTYTTKAVEEKDIIDDHPNVAIHRL